VRLRQHLRKAHAEQLASPDELALFVQACVCVPAHDDANIIRVSWVVSAEINEVAQFVRRLQVAHGGIVEFGPPPRSAAPKAVRSTLAAFRP